LKEITWKACMGGISQGTFLGNMHGRWFLKDVDGKTCQGKKFQGKFPRKQACKKSFKESSQETISLFFICFDSTMFG